MVSLKVQFKGLFYSHYTCVPVASSLKKHNILYDTHDNTQFYLPATIDSSCSLKNFFTCLDDIKCWMSINFLQLSENKTKVNIFGLPISGTRLSNALGPLPTNLHKAVKYKFAMSFSVVYDRVKFSQSLSR